MSKRPGRGSDQYILRFPDGMRDRIKEAAEANGRSMNAEIISVLEQAYPQPGYRSEFEGNGLSPNYADMFLAMKHMTRFLRAKAGRDLTADELDRMMNKLSKDLRENPDS